MARRGRVQPIGVNQCSVCDEFRVCMGEQKAGGVRWCRVCIQQSLGWVQLPAQQRAACLHLFERLEALPRVAALVEALASVPAEMRGAIALGEARRRLYASDHGV